MRLIDVYFITTVRLTGVFIYCILNIEQFTSKHITYSCNEKKVFFYVLALKQGEGRGVNFK